MFAADIDECESSPCNAKDTNATCNDMINGYNCTCSPDWTTTHCDLETAIWIITQKFSSVLSLDVRLRSLNCQLSPLL